MKVLASVALVILIGVVLVKLVLSPFYERYDADECREAYARARTRADTVAVDFHPYSSPRGGRNPRCGEIRVLVPGPAAEKLVSGQPNGAL